MNPLILQQLAASRQADLLKEADGDELIRAARGTNEEDLTHTRIKRLLDAIRSRFPSTRPTSTARPGTA